MTTVELKPSPPLPAECRPTPLWRLILRALLMTFLTYQVGAGLQTCVTHFGIKVYEMDCHLITQPTSDQALLGWGHRQPYVSDFEVLRHGSETIVRLSSRRAPSASPFPALVAEMGSLGYIGSGEQKADLSPNYYLLKNIVWKLPFIAVSFMGVAWSRRRGEPIPPLFGAPIRTAIVAVLVTTLCDILVTTMDVVLHYVSPNTAPMGFPPAARIVYFFLATVGASVSEELFFRGYLLGSFVASKQTGAGVVLTSYLFARAHDWGPHSLIRLSISGLLMAWLAVRKKTLAAPMLAHLLHNAWFSRLLLFPSAFRL